MASSHHLDIHLIGSASSIVRRSAPSLIALLQSRFKCEAQILGLDVDLGPSLRPRVVTERRLGTTLPCGVRVSVWRGDLSDFDAAAVVNAANSRLKHHGGLAQALSEAGGAEVQQESDEYVRNHGEVTTGLAVALGAGKLKCQKIIHAVGPNLSFKPNSHEVSAASPQLERVVRSILEIVEALKLDTVAIPAISSGLFNFPVDQCADIIVKTIMKFYGSSRSHRFKPKDIFLVNNDNPTVKEMERAFKNHLQTSVSSSRTPGSGSKPQTSSTMSYSQAAASGTKGQTSSYTRGAKPRAGPTEVQFNLVRVLLRKGRLEEQKMDVIVNTASESKDLSCGQVSRALLHKAGHKMQQEMSIAPFTGSIIVTNGYHLCKQVYHIFCAERTTVGAHEHLYRSVRDCLWTAVAHRHQSIALPAIGTGVLGFKKQEIAHIMWRAVAEFGMTSAEPLEVHFVIFPSDDNVYKAFEEELKMIRSMQPVNSESLPGSKPVSTSEPDQASAVWNREDKMSMSTEPCIRLTSSSEQDKAEAEAWLSGLLYNQLNTVCISNNFTQLLGEQELEELSLMEVEGVQVEEFLEKGRSGLVMSGNKAEDIAVTALKLQHMLQKVQRQYLKEQVKQLKAISQRVEMERKVVSKTDSQLGAIKSQLHRLRLHLIKVERVENAALERQFRLQKDQMTNQPPDMLLQLVSAQFCDLVCHIGFRPECAPPDESNLGEGLYFAADVHTALEVWPDRSEQFLYLFVAEVLKGKSGHGRPGLVLAPGQDSGPGARCDSVERSGVTVIFNQRQAVPRFIITCSRDAHVSFL